VPESLPEGLIALMRQASPCFPWYGGRDQTRLILTIEPHKIHSMG
jgi:hypothetical protein